jgi:outer membrane lipoprotein SlyB
MRPSPRLLPLAAALALIAVVPACAPANTAGTVPSSALGTAASVSFGTIVGSRPVQVTGSNTGLGTVGGAVAGGVVGSTIGGDWRARTLAGVGGALLGGLAGGAVERGAGSGQAVEFVVREDRGGDIAVVQTNEDALQVGDRVMISRGDRVRLSRAAGGPPPGMPGATPMSAAPGAGPPK